MNTDKLALAYKPTLFIASSTEGLAIAGLLKELLSDDADIDIWHEEDMFAKDNTFLSSLLNLSSFYDYAIMVMSADDHLTKRKQSGSAPRDNILFEYGLFLGRIGPNRAYAVCEKGIQLPSDFFDVKMHQYEKGEQTGTQITAIAAEISLSIRRFYQQYEFTLLPSTTLAVGYYKNFLEQVIDAILKKKPFVYAGDGQQLPAINTAQPKIVIMLPETLSDILPDAPVFIDWTRKHQKVFVHADARPYPFYLQANNSEFFDIPTTLRSSWYTLNELFDPEFLDQKGRRSKVDKKEIRNFEKTLRALIPDDIEDTFISIQTITPEA